MFNSERKPGDKDPQKELPSTSLETPSAANFAAEQMKLWYKGRLENLTRLAEVAGGVVLLATAPVSIPWSLLSDPRGPLEGVQNYVACVARLLSGKWPEGYEYLGKAFSEIFGGEKPGKNVEEQEQNEKQE